MSSGWKPVVKKTNQVPNKSNGLATRNPSNQLLTQYDPPSPDLGHKALRELPSRHLTGLVR